MSADEVEAQRKATAKAQREFQKTQATNLANRIERQGLTHIRDDQTTRSLVVRALRQFQP